MASLQELPVEQLQEELRRRVAEGNRADRRAVDTKLLPAGQPVDTTLIPPPPAASLEPTPVSAWKKASVGTVDLQLPSGHVCRCTRPGLPDLMAQNVLPDLLRPMAQKAIDVGKNGGVQSKEEQDRVMTEVMAEAGGFEAIFDAAARVTAACVVEPPVLYHKRERTRPRDENGELVGPVVWDVIPPEDRKLEVLYTDEIEDNDKFFIFQFVVGGSKDLEAFRNA